MITVDYTLLFQIANMFILMYVLNILLYKPIRNIILKRSENIQGMHNDIETFAKNAKLRQEQVDKKMALASGKAKDALDSARAGAKAAGDEKLAAIKAEADAEKDKKLAEVSSQTAKAEKDLDGNVGEFATGIAGKILGRSL